MDKQHQELEAAQKEYNDRKKMVDGLRTGEVSPSKNGTIIIKHKTAMWHRKCHDNLGWCSIQTGRSKEDFKGLGEWSEMLPETNGGLQ